ncbi:MAG TPA: hypothetical protein VLH15_11035 [Dehalococcoidales bacterium]|nr:hypothetical protein [Dehalococcoidales bacterium]
MAQSKYDYLKTPGITRDTIYPPFLNMIFYAHKESDFQIRFTHVSVPFSGKEDAHKHEFAQVFLFVPCTPDLNAYDAETELYLGDEGEKMVINQTCAIYIPANMTHCPIIHKRVGTPFFFVNCPISGEYSAIVDGQKQAIPVRKK